MTVSLLGYADRFSVAPGETITFMVSAEAPTYQAQLVRLIHGDQDPRGPGFKEEELPSSLASSYQGRPQATVAGSFVQVPHAPALDDLAGLTVQAWIYPTTPDRPGRQGIVALWSAASATGFGLGLDEGALALWVGAGQGRVDVVRGARLRAGTWYFVAASFDGASGRVRLVHKALDPWGLGELGAGAVHEETVQPGRVRAEAEPLLMAATHMEPEPEPERGGRRQPAGLYNGKIDSPRLFRRALTLAEIEALRRGDRVANDLVAAWSFGADFASAHVADTSANGLHGVAVNLPARAVTGHAWSGRETQFTHQPDEYGAIHFHDDDLDDSAWAPTFSLRLPADTRSGVYAVRLRADDDEEYIPFFVRPPRGTATAPVAFLAPTYTYLAYANERLYWKESYRENRHKLTTTLLEPPERDVFLAEHRELGLSLYDLHADGSGVCYSSRLRPILNMRPKYRAWRLHDGPRHFAADLYLVGWLEARGFAYDVITDEDVHHEGVELLGRYRAVLTGSHPEYTTPAMRDALQTYLGGGGRLMYLGGNGFYWVTTVDPERPHAIEVRRGVSGTRAWESTPGECFHSTTGELGGLWRYRGRGPHSLTGVGFDAQGWGGAPGYARQPDSFDPRAAFIFAGVGPDEAIGEFGLVMNGAAGDEIDRLDYALGTPPETLLLATSAGRHSDYYQLTVEEIPIMLPDQGGTASPKVRADMTYFETPAGGAVFSVGSINWLGSLPWNGYDNNVSRITENVLRQFSDRSRDPVPEGEAGHQVQR